jgi:hypothetical protein
MVSHLRKALRQLDAVPETEDRLRRELELRLALGRALIDHEGSSSEEVRAEFERARELCLRLADTKQLLVVFDGLVLNYHFAHAQPSEMLRYAAELSEIGERSGDGLASLWAARARGSARLLQGRFEEARREMQLVIDTYRDQLHRSDDLTLARLPEVAPHVNLGICLTALGYPDSGAASSLEGLKYADEAKHVVSVIAALRRACVQRMMQRDVAAVLELSERLMSLIAEHETFGGSREGTIFRGWAQWRAHREVTSIDRMSACLDELDAAKHRVMLPFLMTSVAELLGEQGERAAALALLDRASELQRVTGELWCVAETMRLRARFGARDPEEAVALLRTSLGTAQEQGARLWELRTATTLAELWRTQHKRTPARDLLAPLCAWFTEGAEAADLGVARQLLTELGAA